MFACAHATVHNCRIVVFRSFLFIEYLKTYRWRNHQSREYNYTFFSYQHRVSAFSFLTCLSGHRFAIEGTHRHLPLLARHRHQRADVSLGNVTHMFYGIILDMNIC